jgi:hypothetical protein
MMNVCALAERTLDAEGGIGPVSLRGPVTTLRKHHSVAEFLSSFLSEPEIETPSPLRIAHPGWSGAHSAPAIHFYELFPFSSSLNS